MIRTMISCIAAISLSVAAMAQKTEGHVTYNVEFSSRQPEAQMSLGMLQGSKMDMYFTEGKSRTEMKMGMLMQTTTIVDTKKKEVLTLLSGMIGQKAVNSQLKQEATEKPVVELIDESKEIAGFKCKKAIISDENDNKYTFWYTDEIKAMGEGQKYFGGKGLPGFPMQMEISQQSIDIRFTAVSYEKLPKKHSLFDIKIPEGYQIMTEEEMGNMMKNF